MKKKIIIIITAVLMVIGAIYLINKKSSSEMVDAIKFKEEYESLNNTVRESDGANYNNIKIAKDNPIKYISAKEAVDIIEEKTGIIYFGANWCPWCRNAVEVLFDASEKNNIDTIYYVNMDDVRNIWEATNGNLVKTQKEAEGYYELLSSLDEVLMKDNYVITDKDGNKYDTGEKRIYMPLVILVKDGHIIGSHVGTVKLNESQTKYDKLTSKQYEELFAIYEEFMHDIKNNNCQASDKCD